MANVLTTTERVGATFQLAVPGQATPVLVRSEASSPPVTTVTDGFDAMLDPESGRGSASVTLAANQFWKGGSYRIRQPLEFNRVGFNLTAVATPGDIVVALYQRADGTSGAAGVGGNTAFALNSVWSFAAVAAAYALATRIDAVGNATLAQGIAFALWGKTNPGASMTATVVNVTSVIGKDVAPLPANAHPWAFTTAIAATSVPAATFNPVVDAVPTSANPMLELRVQRL